MATRKIFKRWKSSMFSSVSPWLILFLEFTRGKLDYESNVVRLSPFVFNQHRTVSRKYPLHDYLLATVVVYSVNTQEFGDIALMFSNLFSLSVVVLPLHHGWWLLLWKWISSYSSRKDKEEIRLQKVKRYKENEKWICIWNI